MPNFYEDFSRALIDAVQHPHSIVLPTLSENMSDPFSTLAPEQALHYGSEHGYTREQIYKLLEVTDPIYSLMEAELHIYMPTGSVSSGISRAEKPKLPTLDITKIATWFFGKQWLTEYTTFLSRPYAFKSEFYVKYNTKFLELMRRCLDYEPKRRPILGAILRDWSPADSDALRCAVQHVPSAMDVSSVDEPSTTPQPAISQNQTDVLSLGVPVAPPVAERRRLVLVKRVSHAGRSKTRKNLRNSDPNPDADSSSPPVVGQISAALEHQTT